jgi:hypothetical protein
MAARSLQGPVKYLAEHPVAYSVSLAGAGSAAGVFASRAARSRGWSRLGWAFLFIVEAVVFFGILGLRTGARRMARPD